MKMENRSVKSLLLMIGAFMTLAGAVISPAMAADTSPHPADNSGKNVRDRNDRTMTPENQSNSKNDITITQQVRKSLQDDKTLSMNAKNVKIITVAGKVTLRGPVASEDEKTKVCDKAKQVAGADNVTDQLEVAPK